MTNQPRAHSGTFARTAFFAGLVAVTAVLASSPAFAHHHRWHGGGAASWSGPTDPGKDAALIVDGETGKVLYERNADIERHPASLTKMMTLYLLFEALKEGKVTMTSELPISAHAAEQRPTNLHLWAGDKIPVDVAIDAIVVRSANDVAVAIAEGIGGTESHFAEMMTEKAHEFGMRSTYYHNASGLPDPLQITTASDLAILARHLAYDFPQYFHFFSLPGFSYRGVTYPTHDNLIGRYDGADGIKTGYTGASGFNLVSSVVRGGSHVIGVVMGGRTAHSRDREMVRLLDQTFTQIAQNPTLVARNQVPWNNVVVNQTATAGFTINAATPTTQPVAGPTVAMVAPPTALPAETDDEEAAESKTNEGNTDLAPQSVMASLPRAQVIQTQPVRIAPMAPPQVAQQAPVQVAVVVPPVKPRPKPSQWRDTLPPSAPTRAPVAAVAVYHPQPKPAALSQEIGEGDISVEHIGSTVPAIGGTSWTIQIGAYANQTLARAELAAYAEKSMDVLGQASRIVVPFQGVDGHTLYRARFGPFPEREAREVCSRLTQRGQSCFAIATR